jgi:hypothetical protein
VQQWIQRHIQQKVDDADHECTGNLPF